jgi:hypothetical protein
MLETIRYEELTFPEVADLPRDTPMLIPLGEASSYDWEAVADRVRQRTRRKVDRVCVFPGVPFGFRTRDQSLKPLAVDPRLLRRVLASLIASVKEDGFKRVFVVNGQGAQGFAAKDTPMIKADLSGLLRKDLTGFSSRQRYLSTPQPQQVIHHNRIGQLLDRGAVIAEDEAAGRRFAQTE